jgi:hypothetical protein
MTAVGRPAGLTDGEWQYSKFNSYGCGAFVRNYGAQGSYVIGATGGHAHPASLDALLFDFADNTWKVVQNDNGVAADLAPTDFMPSDTNGSGWMELAMGNVTPNAVPSPPHPYMHALEIGNTGKIGTIVRAAVTRGAVSGPSAHVFDLRSRKWSRLSTNTASYGGNVDSAALFDPTLNRYWLIQVQNHSYNRLEYLDATDWTYKLSPQYGFPLGIGGTPNAILDDQLRLIVLFFQGGALQALNLNNIGAGWVQIPYTGSMPSGQGGRWAKFRGSWYFYEGTGSDQGIRKLTPPNSSPLSNSWTFSTVTVSGAALPQGDIPTGSPSHRTRFCYVPGLDCLAWLGNASSKVTLLRPT